MTHSSANKTGTCDCCCCLWGPHTLRPLETWKLKIKNSTLILYTRWWHSVHLRWAKQDEVILMYSSYIFCIISSQVYVAVLYQQMCIVHFSHGFMSEGGGTNGLSGSVVRTRKHNLFQPPKKKKKKISFCPSQSKPHWYGIFGLLRQKWVSFSVSVMDFPTYTYTCDFYILSPVRSFCF